MALMIAIETPTTGVAKGCWAGNLVTASLDLESRHSVHGPAKEDLFLE